MSSFCVTQCHPPSPPLKNPGYAAGVPRENHSEKSREPTNSTHMTPSLRIKPRPHWLEVSALTTVATPLLSNILSSRLHAVKLLFLDKISMVGTTMLNVSINNRLKNIIGSKEPFRSVRMIVLSDLFQLEPVMDACRFKASEKHRVWLRKFRELEDRSILKRHDDQLWAKSWL